VWLRAAGLGTWVVCGLATAVRLAAGQRPSGPAVALWAAAFAAFGLAFWAATDSHRRGRGRRVPGALVAVQALAAATMLAAAGETLAAAAFVIVAAQLPALTSPPVAALGMALQTLVVGAVLWPQAGPVAAMTVAGAYAGFQLFAYATARLTLSERLARERLDEVNAELVATRERLAETSRVAERARISRDLHDTLGHHLVALSLHLDVAARLADGPAADKVRQAHAIARLLLGDVRDVVSRLCEAGPVDLARSLRALVETPGSPRVHLAVPATLAVPDAGQAEALLRCVQEVVTNAARHAGADNLWIALDQGPDGIALRARDDGRGVAELRLGNGLRGMRERLREHAGDVQFSSRPGGGFEVRGWMPRRGQPA
jgi:signal transduction histidine kinase